VYGVLKILYSDAHCHSNPISGLGASRIAHRFREAGGWFIALVGLPPYHYGIEDLGVEAHLKTYRVVIEEARRIRENGLRTCVLVGFHPAEIDHYFRAGWGLEDIVSLGRKLIDEIARLHDQGLIDGIGEVGRQHYSTAPQRLVASEIIMWYALEIAKDHDMIVHLHLEQGGYSTVESIRIIVDKIGIPRNKIFLHHSTYNEALWAEKYGFWYTVPAKKRVYDRVFPNKPSYVLTESDFIDDPRRPGVSAYPWDIVSGLKELLVKGVIDEEYVYRVEVDNIVKAYGVEPP